jgi:hypothetical protein
MNKVSPVIKPLAQAVAARSVAIIILLTLAFFVPSMVFADDVSSVQGHADVSAKAADASSASASKAAGEQDSASVIMSFANDKSAKSDLVAIEDQTKRLVMFILGVPLLLFLIATVSLGVAMGVYGKQVFVAHMVCAGFSLSLALGHAVVGIVWFYPF